MILIYDTDPAKMGYSEATREEMVFAVVTWF